MGTFWLFQKLFRWHLICVAILAVLPVRSAAQSEKPANPSGAAQASAGPGDSIATAASESKTQQTSHAKKVFTDDDLDVTSGPLPRLKMEGTDKLA